jgi:cytochrome c oxidase accessory protein FixG
MMTSSIPAPPAAGGPARPARPRGPGRWSRVRTWRRLAEAAQALLVLGLPFLRVRGESALRFDVPTLRLHAFGAVIWMDELLVVLALSFFLLFAFLLLTVLFGRLWCGWACPQTALVDLSGFLQRARARGGWRAALGWAAVALASALVGANLLWYFVEPGEFFRRAAAFSLGPVLGWSWAVLAGLVFVDLGWWRQRFCATTCPYAKLQGALLDRNSLVIAYDSRRAADCVECKACVRVCPVGIDIRDGLQAACTSCGECVDACAPIMARLRRPPKLVGYFFGAPGTARRLLRPGVAALAVLTAASLALTVAVAAERSPLELTVTSSADAAPHRLPSGETFQAVAIALENRGREALALRLSLAVPGVTAQLRPDAIRLAPGEHRVVRVAVTARGVEPAPVTGALAAEVEGHPELRAVRAVTLRPAGGAR